MISAENAAKDTDYMCPSCGAKLIFRAGNIRIKHFAHLQTSNCSIESILHKTAKRLIKDAIINNSNGNKSIILNNCCQNCAVKFYSELPPKTFSGANEEVRVNEYICDVVGYRGGDIVLALEVFNTHEVDEKKGNNLPIHWVELKAEEIISNPYKWNPTQSRLKPIFCKKCKNDFKHIQRIADKWGIDRNLYSTVKNPDSATYIAGTETCFRCKEEIPVFWWRGVPFCEIEPPHPMPKTIKHRFSKQYGGSYWANTCINCNMTQGDNFLFLIDNAPLENLPLSSKFVKNNSGSVNIVGGKSAISEFVKTIIHNR